MLYKYEYLFKGAGLPFAYFAIVPKITQIVIHDKGYGLFLPNTTQMNS